MEKSDYRGRGQGISRTVDTFRRSASKQSFRQRRASPFDALALLRLRFKADTQDNEEVRALSRRRGGQGYPFSQAVILKTKA
jgi:hypothetical protein